MHWTQLRQAFGVCGRRTGLNRTGILVLALAVPLFLCACSDHRRSYPLPGAVTSPAAALPLAQKIQMEQAPGTFLQRVMVIWERERQDFKVYKITYIFASGLDTTGVAVSMDNSRHLAYVETNAPGPLSMSDEPLPVDFSGKSVQEILELALRDSLGAFCSSVPPGQDNILFELQGSERGPFWHITGTGTDTQGVLTQTRLDIDAGSGAVLKRSFNRGSARR